MKKKIIRYLPYVLVGLFATNLAEGWRLLEQTDFWDRLVALPDGIGIALQNPLPSFHPIDLIFGALFAVILYTAVYLKSKNAKKYRHGIERTGAYRCPKSHEEIMRIAQTPIPNSSFDLVFQCLRPFDLSSCIMFHNQILMH